MVSKSEIIEMLRTNDRAVARALVVLNQRQTVSEQATESTRVRNGAGFRPCHARMGTSMANFLQSRGFLTPRQIAYWRQEMKDGRMRIEIYAGQLHQVAKAKTQVQDYTKTASYAKTAALNNNLVKVAGEFVPQGDVGNLREELMVLEERAAREEDEEALDRIHDRMIQINEAIDEIYRNQYKMGR
jgi:hypothetical protein